MKIKIEKKYYLIINVIIVKIKQILDITHPIFDINDNRFKCIFIVNSLKSIKTANVDKWLHEHIECVEFDDSK